MKVLAKVVDCLAQQNASRDLVVALHLVNERNMRNNVRDMRKNVTLAAILSPTRQAILTTLFLRPDKVIGPGISEPL
jgi:hypothetical protein